MIIYVIQWLFIFLINYWLGLYWLQQLGKWWCRSQVACLFTFEAPWGDKRTYEKKGYIRFRMFCLNHGLCACFVFLFRSVLFCFVLVCLFVCLFVFALVLLVCLFLPLLSSFHCVLLLLLVFCSFHCLFGSPLFRFRRLYIYVCFFFNLALCVILVPSAFVCSWVFPVLLLHVACWFYLESLPFL